MVLCAADDKFPHVSCKCWRCNAQNCSQMFIWHPTLNLSSVIKENVCSQFYVNIRFQSIFFPKSLTLLRLGLHDSPKQIHTCTYTNFSLSPLPLCMLVSPSWRLFGAFSTIKCERTRQQLNFVLFRFSCSSDFLIFYGVLHELC